MRKLFYNYMQLRIAARNGAGPALGLPRLIKQVFCFLILAGAVACRERYDAPVKSPVTGYLVVDGVVNSGPDSTTIKLSRTSKLENRQVVYEAGAKVNLEGADGSIRVFTEKPGGQYVAGNLSLNTQQKYRLNITAKDGRAYRSDFAPVKYNPPIDSISWKLETDGLHTYVNTHDPTDSTRYYQWVYDETWEFHSSFLQVLKYKVVSNPKGDIYSVVYKDSSTFSYDPTIVTCWQFNKPTAIMLGSTAKLSKDIVYLPIVFVPRGSVKGSVLYSLNLKQYAWTSAGYEFLDRMRKNTETTGSVFDAQPSELNSNFHSLTDATEPVIGYFNICPVRSLRIFIKNAQLRDWRYNPDCFEIVVENISDSIVQKAGGLLPTGIEKPAPTGGIETFRAAQPVCVDCTLSGTNKKPSYWPQ